MYLAFQLMWIICVQLTTSQPYDVKPYKKLNEQMSGFLDTDG
jgi:hypothetical protein